MLDTLLALHLAAAATTPTPADPAAAVAKACGGDPSPAQFAAMPKQERDKWMACAMRAAADQMSRTLPQKIDPATTLERVSVKGMTLTYHYRADVDRATIPTQAIESLKLEVRRKVCAAGDMRSMITQGASYGYEWIDRSGTNIANLLVNAC